MFGELANEWARYVDRAGIDCSSYGEKSPEPPPTPPPALPEAPHEIITKEAAGLPGKPTPKEPPPEEEEG